MIEVIEKPLLPKRGKWTDRGCGRASVDRSEEKLLGKGLTNRTNCAILPESTGMNENE
jgi:hypothetical protein